MEHVRGEGGARPLLGWPTAEGGVPGDEKGVLDLGRDGLAPQDEELDGEGLPELPEALDPLQGGGGAAVLESSALNRDILLQRGHGEVTVEDVAAFCSLDGQVVAVVSDPTVAALFDVDVGRTDWNSHNVAVSISGGKRHRNI